MSNPFLRLAVLLTFVGPGLTTFQAAAAPGVQELALAALAKEQPRVAVLTSASDSAPAELRFTQAAPNDSLELWSGATPLDWNSANFLVCEVSHTNPTSEILYLEFFRRSARAEGDIVEQGHAGAAAPSRSPRISAKIGVLPGLRTQVIFPLEQLNGQRIFLPRFPRQLKGTVTGSRLERDEISAVRLRTAPVQTPEHTGALSIYRVFLAKDLPAPLPKAAHPCVDQFGQWAARDWPGKVRSEAELKARLKALEAEASGAGYPADWSRFGGWKEKRFEATGFFRTQNDGRRWWLVDPEGCAFLSAGVDCIGPNVSGATRGQEDLFAWLPKESRQFGSASRERGVDFLQLNLSRAFGENWRADWSGLTTSLLRRLAFNTVANWSDLEFARSSKIPYVLPMRGFPRTPVLLYRDFPDVFAQEYTEDSRRFARQLESFKDDPYLIGYFLANEPNWAFGKNNLAFEMFATARDSATKREFVRWIQNRYANDLARFNRDWKLALSDFGQLAARTFSDPPSPAATDDFWEFSKLMVARYVDVPCDAVKAVDSRHLNLGIRYAWVSSDLLYMAGQRFDVFSINGYSFPAPPATAEIARRSGKPVMIGEFHFGATDRGLPATGIQGVASQADRAKAYRYYVEQGFARPEVVGLHYFQWFDQPITGRFDGENYNIGFLDICHQPYPELMKAARQTHERVYQVASGQEKPFAEMAQRAPAVFY